MRVFIDFETASPADLPSIGAYRYASTAEPLCLAIGTEDGHVGMWMDEELHDGCFPAGIPRYSRASAVKLVAKADEVYAHNANFERCVWPKFCHTPIPLEKWRCSAAEAAAMGLPRSLEGAGAALGCTIQKNPEGKKLIKEVCIGGSREPAKVRALLEYCVGDVRAEIAVFQRLRRLSESELALWRLDQRINDLGLRIDIQTVAKIRSELQADADNLLREFGELTGLDSPKQTEKFKAWLAEHGLEVPDLKSQTLKKMSGEGDTVRPLELRKTLAKASTAKLDAFLDYADENGDMRGLLLFHGASTGRWTARGPQIQNLPRGYLKPKDAYAAARDFAHGVGVVRAMWGDPHHVASAALRTLIIPRDGYRFCALDFSQIEARVTAWFAGEEPVLEAFRAGRDLYKVAAGAIYGKDPLTIGDKSDERQIGKVASLALGFGGGVGAFQKMAAIYGVKVEDSQAEVIVRAWRAANPSIARWWRQLEQAAIKAIQVRGKAIQCGRVAFRYDGEFLQLRLPSKRVLWYAAPKIQKNKFDHDAIVCMGVDKNKWLEYDLWYGVIAENVVQAAARDVMAEAMLRLDVAGVRIVATIHDEILCEVIDSPEVLEHTSALVTESPTWAGGLPIAASGWAGDYYRKD